MPTTQITKTNGQQLARPLKVLVPLIQRDIENAEHAGDMFYTSAGGKLVEVKDLFNTPDKTDRKLTMEFWDWFRREEQITYPDGRPVSEESARRWMGMWEAENVRGERFESQEDFRRRTTAGKSRAKNPERKYREYHAPVDRILSGISAKELAERKINAAKESELERKLALQLIKIGYGVLATKLHPDKGGSSEAMRRLNTVAKTLRGVYSTSGFLV